jgi:protein KRI1
MMERPAKRAKLLSDDENDSDLQSRQPQSNGFSVNEAYAKRFEHNKKREEKDRLEEKYGKAEIEEQKSDESSSDESEDDDAELATEDVDDEILATLNAIRSKDPKVYDKGVKFYREYNPDLDGVKIKKEKPMYLQDYHRQNLLAGHAGDEAEDSAPQTYQEEQDKMKRELVGSMHQAANGAEHSGSEDGFLVTKSKPKHEDVPANPREITDADVAEADKDPETYLSNFMAARAWLPTATSRFQAFDSDDSDDDARADAFEEAYNMRFEDPSTANEKLQSFARDVSKYSVRREEKKSSRQRTRDREREKKEAEKREREEERARLRNLRIEEVESKVKRIKAAAGLKTVNLGEWSNVIEGDFNDDEWETEMRKRFGDDYYAEDDEVSDAETGKSKKKKPLHKPTWNDDIDIKDLVPDFQDEEDTPAFSLSDDGENEGSEDGGVPVDVSDGDGEDIGEQQPRKKSKSKKDRVAAKSEAKRDARRERRQIEQLVDSNPPLPAASSSNAAGFRYRETSPTTFGLSARDILFADDAQLNQFAGLKKLATWREDAKKAKDRKRLSKKGRLREWRKETFGSKEGPQWSQQDDEKAKDVAEGGAMKKGKKRKRSKKT